MQEFSPVSSNKLYIQIYHQLYDAIASGRYKIGDKLPSEKDLCMMFNVSRVPVREALCALELNGMVDSIQGTGVYVKEITPTGNDGAAGQQIEPQEIIRARMVLEPDIARQAAENISEEDKQTLKEILIRFKSDTDNTLYYSDSDIEFHLCIAKASGNNLYIAIMNMIFNAMKNRMWENILGKTFGTKKYLEDNFKEHNYIGEAIIGGRADDAYVYMKEHMEKLYERFWS